MTIKLTAPQAALLRHRLSEDDALTEVVLDTDGLEGYTEGDCAKAIALVTAQVDAKSIDPEALGELHRFILCDCLVGSTYFADEEEHIFTGEETRYHYRAAHKAADELEALFGRLFDMHVETARS